MEQLLVFLRCLAGFQGGACLRPSSNEFVQDHRWPSTLRPLHFGAGRTDLALEAQDFGPS